MSLPTDETSLLRPTQKRAKGSAFPYALTVAVTFTLAVVACASYASPSNTAGLAASLGMSFGNNANDAQTSGNPSSSPTTPTPSPTTPTPSTSSTTPTSPTTQNQGTTQSPSGQQPITFKLFTHPNCEPPHILDTFDFANVTKAKVVTLTNHHFDFEFGHEMTETQQGSGIWTLSLPRHKFKQGTEWGFGIQDVAGKDLYDVGKIPHSREKCVTIRKGKCHMNTSPLYKHECVKVINGEYANRIAKPGTYNYDFVWGTCDTTCDTSQPVV